MADSSSFSSLMALVDSHLAKVHESNSDHISENGSQIQTFNNIPIETKSDTHVKMSATQRLPIPNFSFSDSPIKRILDKQVSNMLKAKHLKMEQEQKVTEEKQNFKEEMERLNEEVQKVKLEEKQDEHLVEPVHSSYKIELPCKTDLSYILYEKTPKTKCSAFGKVISARLKPVTIPYVKEKVISNIVRFDFKTKSPCDLFKEKSKKPTMHQSYTFDITTF